MRKIKTGFMFIELLLVLAIIMFIAFKVFKLYFKNPSLNKETQKVISEQGINTTSYKSIIDSTKKKLQGIQDQHIEKLGNTTNE
ncbi:MAG: hypothetical protein Q8O13_00690 [Candidatus Omnitrophota bacterium]|nr:hypothetical protein [Candidatus Omnitrophota bacterium]